MLTLLILSCFAGTDDCHIAIVAAGFVVEKQCQAYAPLMIAGWLVLNPGQEERGHFVCTDKPEYIIGKGRA